MPRDYVERILRARVYDVARETPLEIASKLSARLGNTVYLKREDLQPVFSFKVRGAYNKISNLSTADRERGVIASSAGNHAQGVALAARELGVTALIVMPETTPDIKVDAVRTLGAEIILYGTAYDDAKYKALELAESHGMVFVPPFDDPDVIAGQGTVAMEILRQHPKPLHAVFVAVGGGGLIAGIGAYVKALWPEIKIIGVEPVDAPSMTRALEAGHPVTLAQVGIFADGVAVARVGDETFRIAQQCVDDMILVSGDEICAAVKDIFEDTRSIAEPAGALSVAGLKRYVEREGIQHQSLVAVDCGANINFDRLQHVAERAGLGEQREAIFAVTIPEHPGSLKKFCEILGRRAITEFNYRYAGPGDAHIFLGVELRRGHAERNELLQALNEHGYPVIDLTEDEMAKVHLRHMVGGRAQNAPEEVLYRFDFPERPGALLRFLTRMGELWNISLFHYRNNGSDFGRVLMGMQVPSDELDRLPRFLDDVGYTYVDESANPAYRLFLQ